MSRQPLVGYNHSLPYKGRTYHVQTEDSGVTTPHIFSHLFHQGLILASAKTVYQPEQPSEEVRQTMQTQHKMLMKQLVRGELDAKILQLLGSLGADDEHASPALAEQQRRIRSYHHQLSHAGRVYSIQTYFFSTVISEIFQDKILITSRLLDCRERAAPGSDEIKSVAQQQHKEMILQLRDGLLDARICEILGSLAPREQEARRVAPRRLDPVEQYSHRITHQGIKLDVRTQLFPPQTPHVITDVFHDGRLLVNAEFFNYKEVAAEEDAVDFALELARSQHTEVLREILKGRFDDLIRCVLGDAFLDTLPTNPIRVGDLRSDEGKDD